MGNCIERDLAEFKEIAINGIERAYKVGYEQGYCDGEKKEQEKRMDNNIDAIVQLEESGWMESHNREVYLDGYEEGKASTIKESEQITNQDIADAYKRGYEKGLDDNAFSEEDCIDLLQSTGWMEKHDKEMYLQGKDEAYENPVPTQDAYNQGLSDMFMTLEKTFHMTNDDREKYLGTNYMGDLFELTPLTVLEKVSEYERDKEFSTGSETGGIKVGDVVIVKDAADRPFEGVITSIDTVNENAIYPYCIMFADGSTEWEKTVSVTGRRIDVNSVLKQLSDKEISD